MRKLRSGVTPWARDGSRAVAIADETIFYCSLSSWLLKLFGLCECLLFVVKTSAVIGDFHYAPYRGTHLLNTARTVLLALSSLIVSHRVLAGSLRVQRRRCSLDELIVHGDVQAWTLTEKLLAVARLRWPLRSATSPSHAAFYLRVSHVLLSTTKTQYNPEVFKAVRAVPKGSRAHFERRHTRRLLSGHRTLPLSLPRSGNSKL